jgi:urease accessory protein UreF
MLFLPIVCAAILSRHWRWSELATVTAAFAALSPKNSMVVLALQRFVWKQRHPETTVAEHWHIGWSVILLLSGLVLLMTWPSKATATLGLPSERGFPIHASRPESTPAAKTRST